MQKIFFCLYALSSSTSALRIAVSDPEYIIAPPEFPIFDLTTSNTSNWEGTRIVAVGWKKTGTTSMRIAYNAMGLGPVGGVNKCKKPSCMRKFAAVEDAYACCNQGLVQVMKALYPGDKVKFVLTERTPQKWKASIDHWVNRPDKGNKFKKAYGKLMGAGYGTPEFYEKYEAHNAFIKDLFKDEPDRLLVLNLEDDDSVQNMKKLCDFVGVKGPQCNTGFPHSNQNAYGGYHQFSEAAEDGFWLNIDDVKDELDDFDEELATRDWIQWYADRGLSLSSNIIFKD